MKNFVSIALLFCSIFGGGQALCMEKSVIDVPKSNISQAKELKSILKRQGPGENPSSKRRRITFSESVDQREIDIDSPEKASRIECINGIIAKRDRKQRKNAGACLGYSIALAISAIDEEDSGSGLLELYEQ